jgi:hypothetical protein
MLFRTFVFCTATALAGTAPRENHKMATEPRHRVESLQWQIYWFERYLNNNASWPTPTSE